jgi:hypothetical protein
MENFILRTPREKITWKYRCRWEDNIEMNIRGTGFENMDLN